MKTSAFLNAIWRGDVVAEGQAGQAWFTEALSRFIPVPWAVFVNKTGKGRLEVFVDDHEIEPGLSLGDVLCEELESELPYGSLIVLQPEGVGEASLTAGLIVAEALVGAVSQGLVPLDEETSSLYALACAADARAEEVTLEGFEPLAFRAGLARGLSRYWFGDESVTRRSRSSVPARASLVAVFSVMSSDATMTPSMPSPVRERGVAVDRSNGRFPSTSKLTSKVTAPSECAASNIGLMMK